MLSPSSTIITGKFSIRLTQSRSGLRTTALQYGLTSASGVNVMFGVTTPFPSQQTRKRIGRVQRVRSSLSKLSNRVFKLSLLTFIVVAVSLLF